MYLFKEIILENIISGFFHKNEWYIGKHKHYLKR